MAPAVIADASEAARMACDCRECGGSASMRPGGDCLRDAITEAILDTLTVALQEQRKSEWSATYDAVLVDQVAQARGLVDDAREQATRIANAAHGELKS